MKQIIRFYKRLNNLQNFVIRISGTLLVVVLCVWSIVFIKGGAIDNAQLDLKPLVSSPGLAWLWIGMFIVSSVGLIVELIGEIKKGISKTRNPQLSAEEKVRSLFWWIFKH